MSPHSLINSLIHAPICQHVLWQHDAMGTSMTLRSDRPVSFPGSPLTGSVALGKLLNSFDPRFPQL